MITPNEREKMNRLYHQLSFGSTPKFPPVLEPFQQDFRDQRIQKQLTMVAFIFLTLNLAEHNIMSTIPSQRANYIALPLVSYSNLTLKIEVDLIS